MSEPAPDGESAQPGASNREFIVVGIVGGSMILLVVLVFGLCVLFFGIVNYSISQALAGCVLISLIAALPGMLIGMKALDGFEKKESSGTKIIVKSALVGILGGSIVVIVLTPFLGVWIGCC